MTLVAPVTRASSGSGRMIAHDPAAAGHAAHASMRDVVGRNAGTAGGNGGRARERGGDLRSIALDVRDDASIAAAVEAVVAGHGRIDVPVQDAGPMVHGPSEASIADQLARLTAIDALGARRVARAAAPHMRAARGGLVAWIASGSAAGGVPPLLGRCFAAKAGLDALAVCHARGLAASASKRRWSCPGACTTGTDRPGLRSGGGRPRGARHRRARPGERPFRTVIDPADDGAAVGFPVIDRVRPEFLHRIGRADPPHPTRPATSAA